MSVRDNVGMKNPYALADSFDSHNRKSKKEWKKILMGLDPKFGDIEAALQDSLKKEAKFNEWFEGGKGVKELFGEKSPIYTDYTEDE